MQAQACNDALAMRVQATPDPFIAALPTDVRERMELATKVGVNMSTIWRWAEGKSRPSSHATRQAIADALGRTTDELFPSAPEQAAA